MVTLFLHRYRNRDRYRDGNLIFEPYHQAVDCNPDFDSDCDDIIQIGSRHTSGLIKRKI